MPDSWEVGRYSIEVEPGNGRPRVARESLYAQGMMFDSDPPDNPLAQDAPQQIAIRIRPGGSYRRGHVERFAESRPVLTQIEDRLEGRQDAKAAMVREWARSTIATLSSMRFLDLEPDAMRLPSLPGQTTLGDRGENLSSVLQAIYEDERQQQALIAWIRELSPMDVVALEFPADQTGRVLLSLVETGGRRISAYSASGGTLRFLAMLAALLGPEPAGLYFIEELENGLHPARLHLLLDLIESRVKEGALQVVVTTHSPQLLRLLSPASRDNAVLVYRLQGEAAAQLKAIRELPAEAREVVGRKDVGELFQAGWFENVMSFLQDEQTPAEGE